MYAVIFKAKTKELDESYVTMAKRMRALAMSEYACCEFTAVTEGSEEIAISYWNSLEDIKKWCEGYSVETVEILSKYSKG